MTSISKLVSAYSTHAIYLEQLANGMGNRAIPYIESINDRVAKIFNNLGKRRISAEKEREIRKQVREIIKDEIGSLVAQMKAEQRDLASYELGWNDRTILATLQSDIATTLPSVAQVAATATATPIKVGNGRYTTYNKMFKDFTEQQADIIDGILINAMVNGETNRDIADLIERDLDTWSSGAESISRTLARTGTNHYTTQARLLYGKDNDDIIIGWRSNAVLDSRTSNQCAALDGEIMKVTDPKWSSFATPRHPNCRTALTPEVDGRFKYDDSETKRPTNFLVNGDKDPKRVSSKKTYYEEMSKLSARDQDVILGPSLGKAFRKMDNPDKFAREIINQSTLNPLTIKELKQKDNELARILREQDA